MTSDAFDDVVRSAFRSAPGGPDLRVGVEVEYLCMDVEGRRPAPPIGTCGRPGTVETVDEVARAGGWTREQGPGLPRYRLPDGTTVSWEPGGQIEFATAPLPSLDAVDRAVRSVTRRVADALAATGVGLLARALDPWTPVDEPEIWLDHPRYRRMAAHYDRLGPDGRRMMRQTAGVHVNLDFGPAPLTRWARANACVPATIATFANAHRIEGRTGWRSERSRAWRRLDPGRTGAFAASDAPERDYIRFARRADAFVAGPEGVPAEPWGDRDDKLGAEAWRDHLTTLFPEVRPRGYLELRSVDALPPRLVVVAAAFLCGIVYGKADLPAVPDPTPDRLEAAGRDGVLDPAVHREVMDWWACAERGLDGLGPAFASAALRKRVARYRTEVTGAGRDPASASGDWVAEVA